MADQDMLINYVPGEECRIALVENGVLEELYTERASDDIHVGNIYRGKITNVEPSIQAAFIDFGLGRNGFLHISDLHPRYFGKDTDATEKVGKRTPRRDRPPIQQALRRGQQMLVQVLKEGIGTKGPTLTSYLSIPGRFLVMMPDMERHGVSRKVDDEDQRREMRKILDDLDPPEEFGFIVRTAGVGRPKTELKRDLAYLQRLWRTIEKRLKSGKGPAELYRESDLVIRTLRDVLNTNVKRIVVDNLSAARRARDFLRIAMPRTGAKVYYYNRPIPLFDAFDVERQIETINSRVVPLKSGGSLVIESTEAMVTVDVNSGKFRDKSDSETTAFETNKEAVDQIARQLRLRDLGGVLVLDLIDMYQHKHRREIERRFRDNLKRDRARSKTLKINDLGLLSLTRQRMRPSLKRSLSMTCPTCDGMGAIKTTESVVLDVMRQLAVVASAENVQRVHLTITPRVGAMLLNRKRHALHLLEEQLVKKIEIDFDEDAAPDAVQLVAYDGRGSTVDLEKLPPPKKPRFDKTDEVDAHDGKGAAADESEGLGAWDEDEDEPTAEAPSGGEASDKAEADADASKGDQAEDQGEGEGGKRKRRRRRRRRSGGSDEQSDDQDRSSPDEAGDKQQDPKKEPKKKSQKQKDQQKGESGKQAGDSDEDQGPDGREEPDEAGDATEAGEGEDEKSDAGGRSRRRRRRGGRRRRKRSGGDSQGEQDPQAQGGEENQKPEAAAEPDGSSDESSSDEAEAS